MNKRIILGLFTLGTLFSFASNEQGKVMEKELLNISFPIIGQPSKCYEIQITTIYSENYALTDRTVTIEYGLYTKERVENYIEQLKLNNPDYMYKGTGYRTFYSYEETRIVNCVGT